MPDQELFSYWVTLSFVETEVSNFSLRPNYCTKTTFQIGRPRSLANAEKNIKKLSVRSVPNLSSARAKVEVVIYFRLTPEFSVTSRFAY